MFGIAGSSPGLHADETLRAGLSEQVGSTEGGPEKHPFLGLPQGLPPCWSPGRATSRAVLPDLAGAAGITSYRSVPHVSSLHPTSHPEAPPMGS